MKNWILKKKIAFAVMFLGAITGLLYWHFVGCVSGNCSITANLYTNLAYGGLLGWLVGDFATDKMNKSKN